MTQGVMIFAAGFGTRMLPLTETMPKPLVQVAGTPLLDHALEQVRGADLSPVVINTHYLADQIEAHVVGDSQIVISDEQDQLLDTGGGLKKAAPLLAGEALISLNSDAVWTGGNAMVELLAAWDPNRMDALLLLQPRDKATGHSGKGDFLAGDDGRLTRGPGDVYSGAQIVSRHLVEAAGETVFSLNLLWDRAARQNRLFGTFHKGGWCDVGQPESIPLAEALLSGHTNV